MPCHCSENEGVSGGIASVFGGRKGAIKHKIYLFYKNFLLTFCSFEKST